jgi:hypothetical protein
MQPGDQGLFLKKRGEIPLDPAKTFVMRNGTGDLSNGKKYEPGVLLEFGTKGEYTIKARAISRDGKYKGEVYTQEYTVKMGAQKGK